MIEGLTIVNAHPDLVKYVDHLQRKNAEALSFYPRQVFERESAKGRIFLGLLNGQPCGYIYVGSGARGDLKCHQVCVQYDARRSLYGAEIVGCVERYAILHRFDWITLRCGFDLPANQFWGALGYRCIGVVEGGVRRQRQINIWQKCIGAELFAPALIAPAVGRIDASLWSKHKQVGVTTQFNRGRALRDYRRLVRSGQPKEE